MSIRGRSQRAGLHCRPMERGQVSSKRPFVEGRELWQEDGDTGHGRLVVCVRQDPFRVQRPTGLRREFMTAGTSGSVGAGGRPESAQQGRPERRRAAPATRVCRLPLRAARRLILRVDRPPDGPSRRAGEMTVGLGHETIASRESAASACMIAPSAKVPEATTGSSRRSTLMGDVMIVLRRRCAQRATRCSRHGPRPGLSRGGSRFDAYGKIRAEGMRCTDVDRVAAGMERGGTDVCETRRSRSGEVDEEPCSFEKGSPEYRNQVTASRDV